MTALTPKRTFRHQALFYQGEQGFLDGTLPFVRAGVRAQEPTLVVVGEAKIRMLREALNGDAETVLFADMAEIGSNPARIIPAWRDFVDAHGSSDRGLRGIGEPIWAGRSPAELVECQLHESLLNLAFADTGPFMLLCPYDTGELEPDVVDEARRSHPHLVEDQHERDSSVYRGLDAVSAPFAAPLPDPPAGAHELRFGATELSELRALVAHHACQAAISDTRVHDLTLGVSEVASNSVCHGGGEGLLRIWRDADALICEIRDRGLMAAPLAGRVMPPPDQLHGRGLWVANQLCDLVQIRSFAEGTVVRVHMRSQEP